MPPRRRGRGRGGSQRTNMRKAATSGAQTTKSNEANNTANGKRVANEKHRPERSRRLANRDGKKDEEQGKPVKQSLPAQAPKRKAEPNGTPASEEPPSKQQKTLKPPVVRKRVPVAAVYEDVWKEVYLAGTEWDQMKLVYSIDWEFDHLDEALTDGDLKGKKVHLFGATEPQLLMRNEKDSKGEVIPVPVIVAVVSEFPPPATVGLNSVQRSEEKIVPMSEIRMGWHAYSPPNVGLRRAFKPNVFVLKCNERHARLRNMNETDVHKYDYVLPYFVNPEREDDSIEKTEVQVIAELEGRSAPVMCEYDYDMDDLDEFVEETIANEELDAEKHTEPLKKAIMVASKATKLKNKAEKEERRKQIDAISPEEREAIKSMKVIKFYPENEWPDVSKIKSKFVNRYYGQATEVV